jgi:arylsulfatase
MRVKGFRAWICLCALVLLGVSGFGRRHAAAADDVPPYNVILITPDQLRADSMHTYGYDLPDTPNIDKFAAEGTLFYRAYSAGSWTTPSFGAIHTGLFPTVHGMGLPPFLSCGNSITRPMVQGEDLKIPDLVNLSLHKPVLAEVLKGHGMVTAVDNANCWSLFDVIKRGWDSVGFFPGWELTLPGHPATEDPIYFTAPKTLSWAQTWLAAHKGQRFFLWVHFMEPHSPYNFPKEYDRFRTPEDFPDLYEDTPEGVAKLHSLSQLGNYHAIRRETQLYSDKILYVDDYVGQLLRSIHDLGLDSKSIVILTSDHGELLYSHPKDYNTTDHFSLYDTDVHIPLIVRGPGISAGPRVNTIVSHYDLLPTILDLENLPPQPHVDGKSFKDILLGSSSGQIHDYLYGEQFDLVPEFSVRDERYKLIATIPDGSISCFDHLVDPGETHNICPEIPEIAARLKKALSLHLQQDIQEAKAYPDWEDNLALAVLEQRDSKGLELLAPREEVVTPQAGNSEFQLNGRTLWTPSTDSPNCEGGLCYWAPAGRGAASVTWRSEMPLTGKYDVYFKYGGTGQPTQGLATDASLTVKFKQGSLMFAIDENLNQGRWNLVGRFDHPTYVRLTDLANGSVVAGAIRFLRVE